MKVELIGILVALANILGAGMIVPQAIRIHRYGDFGGVSAVWIGVGIGMNLWWLGYAVQGQLWGLVPVSAAAVGLYSIIALQCLNLAGRSSWRSLALGVFGLGSLPLPFLVFGSWSSAGLVIGLCYGLQFAPALFSAFRSDRLDGISQLTWSMAFIEAAIWVVYGTSVGDQALMVGGGGGAAMAILILLRIRFVQPGTMPRFASLGCWACDGKQQSTNRASGTGRPNRLRLMRRRAAMKPTL